MARDQVFVFMQKEDVRSDCFRTLAFRMRDPPIGRVYSHIGIGIVAEAGDRGWPHAEVETVRAKCHSVMTFQKFALHGQSAVRDGAGLAVHAVQRFHAGYSQCVAVESAVARHFAEPCVVPHGIVAADVESR